MSVASRVLPCSAKMRPFRKRACASRGLDASTLLTRSSAAWCCPARRSLLASCTSVLTAWPNAAPDIRTNAERSAGTLVQSTRRRTEKRVIVLYFSRLYESLRILDQALPVHNLDGLRQSPRRVP